MTTVGRAHPAQVLTALFLGLALLASPAAAQVGSLDTSFHTDGKVTTNFGTVTATANARAVGVQKWPDGTLKRIVVGGASANGAAKQFVLEGFLPNGTLDGSFGNGGIVYQAMGGSTDQINAISIQPDGKIVAAGFSNAATVERFAVLRLTADGQIDTTFGAGDGMVLEYVAPSSSVPGDPITGSTNRGMGVATYLDANNATRIVVVGFGRDSAANPQPRYRVVVAKFKDDGTLDTTFANQGRLVDDATGSGGQSRGWNVAVDSSRRILVSGDHNTGIPASQASFLVVRYNENGTRDNSFDGDGVVVLNPGGQDLARAINVKDLNANAGEEIVVAGDSDTRYASYMLKSDGTLDTSYNTTGGRIDSVSSGQDIPERVLFTPTNPVKIVLAGMGENGNVSGDFMFAAARINLNGSLDTTFDGDGYLNHNLTAGTDWGQDAEIQPDGKLIIVGDTNAGSENFVKVARYTTSGALDTGTFNAPTGVYSVTTIVGGTSDVGQAFALDSSGRLLVAGSTSLAGGTDFAVARYLNTGALDTTFSTDGLTQVSFGAYDYAYAVIGTPDGGLIAAGDANSGVQWGLARFNPNGSLNTGFDGDGLRTDSFGSNGGRPHAMALDGNGMLVVAGYWLSPTGSSANMAVARYNAATGALDTSFDGDGHVSFNISGFTQAKGLAIQPDGKIVLFGHVTVGSATHVAVVRLLSTGAFDTTFGGTGRVTTDLPSPNIPDPQNPPLRTAHAHSGFIQSDGKILAAGKVVRDLGGGQTFNTFALVRYNKDGSLDPTFGTGGIKYDSFLSDSIDEIHAIFPQHDEKMLAIGTSQKFLIGTSDFAVMRYNWDNGSLDPFFDTDGKQTTPIGPVQDFAYGGYVYPASEADANLRGRLYLGGVDYSVGDFAVARYTGDSAPVNGPTAAPDLDASSDSGRFQIDDVTNDSTPTFNVTSCVNGQTLALHVNNVVRNPKARYLCRETSAVNAYPLTFPSLPVGEGPLADATYSFRPYAMTGHGSTAPGSTIAGVRIDTVVGVPTLAAPAPENVILDAESPILISGSGSEIGANVNSNADVQIYDTVSGSDVKVGCSETVNDPGNPARPQVLLGTNAGTWSCTAQGLALGKHMVKVRQVDVAWNTSGFGAVRTFFRKATTTTVITSSANPSVYGQPVAFTATVSSNVQTPDGSVEFYLDGAVVPTATVALNGQGLALYTPSLTLLPVGAHTLTARFLENDRFKPSQHLGFAQTVLKADTTTSIVVAPEPSVVGQQVTITFTIAPVAPGAGTPTGTVTVTDGTQQCQATVAAGSCTITYTSPGVRNLTASYPGDSNFNPSTPAAPTAHTVNKANTTTTITSDSPDPSVVAEVVTINFSVAVTAPGAGIRTGNVTVSDGVQSCTSAINAAGTGSCTIALTTMGMRTLTAIYEGDGNFNGSTSGGELHDVQNRPPVLHDQSLGSLPENSANGTVVGTVVATDPDAGQTLVYSITGGNPNGAFAINPGTGQVTVANTAALDFETTPAFSLTVQATDDGAPIKSDTGIVTIGLTNVNEAPVVADQSRGPVPENSANATTVGLPVTATDPDVGSTLGYAITGGNMAGAFAIHPSTGQITVANSVALDFETTPSFSLTVSVTDNAPTPLSSSATVTVTLSNVNEAPVVNDQPFSVNENVPSGTVVGTVVATDPDAGQALAYAITAGNNLGGFAINPANGQITVATASVLDFEVNPSFGLTVSVTDNGAGNLSDTAAVTISLNNQNDPPVLNDVTLGTLAENSANGTVAGSVTGTDPEGQTLAYTITGGNTGGAFAIHATTGQITVASSAALDFDTVPAFNLTVTATDNGAPTASDTAVVTIPLQNVNEAPVVNDQTLGVAESATVGTVVGTVAASDPDAATTLAYAITAGNTAGHFALNSGNGQITVAAALDFETTPTYALTVEVTDNAGTPLSDTATVTLSVTNANEAPVIANQSLPAVGQSSANGTVVGTVAASDPDAGQALTYAITGGNTGGAFAISATTGQVTVANSAAVLPANGPFSLTVQVTDNGTVPLSASGTVTINVLPVSLSISDVTQPEGDSGTTAFSFTVTVTGTLSSPAVVNYATLDGSALSASDYQVASGTLTFNPGDPAQQTVTVQVNGDLAFENAEAFTVELSGATGAGIADASGAATVTNDDGQPVISIADVKRLEGGDSGTAPASFSVSLSNPSGFPVTVQYDTMNGTAVAGTDFVGATAQTLTFNPGVTVLPVDVLVNGDPFTESMKGFKLRLSSATGATLGADVDGDGAIVDDDPAWDPNNDGYADLLWQHAASGDLGSWFLNGTNLIGGGPLVFSGVIEPQWRVSVIRDFDGDGKSDLVWQYLPDGTLGMWLMDGSTLLNSVVMLPSTLANPDWRLRGAGDFDGDGKPDLVLQHPSGPIEVWTMNGNTRLGVLAVTPTFGPNSGWEIAGVTDFDQDLKPDFLLQNVTTGNVAVWFMNGVTAHSSAYLSAQNSDPNWRVVSVADVDREGHPDLIWRHKVTGDLATWTLNGMTLTGGSYLNPQTVADPNWLVAGAR